jgi:hypothetical protein
MLAERKMKKDTHLKHTRQEKGTRGSSSIPQPFSDLRRTKVLGQCESARCTYIGRKATYRAQGDGKTGKAV